MEKNSYKNITGYFDFGWLYGLVTQLIGSKAHFVEIGSWLGKSTAFMCEEIAKSSKKINFDAIDPWVDYGGFVNTFDIFKKNLSKFNLLQHVNPVVLPSEKAVLQYEDRALDFLFIDGDHTYEGARRDIVDWRSKLKEGAVIAGHDYNWPGVKDAVDELLGSEAVVIGIVWLHTTDPDLKDFFRAVKLIVDGELERASNLLVSLSKCSSSVFHGFNSLAKNLKSGIEILLIGRSVYSKISINNEESHFNTYLFNNRGVHWVFELAVLALCRRSKFVFSEDLLQFMIDNNMFSDKLHELYFYQGIYKELKYGFKDNHSFNMCIDILKGFETRDNRDTYILAAALKRVGRNGEAESFFQKILDGDFDKYYSVASMFHVGELAYGKRDFDKSYSLFKKVIEHTPEHQKALKYLKQLGQIKIK